MQAESDVVVTGMGVVSPIGVSLEHFWESIREGRSGVDLLEDHSQTPVKFGGAVKDFDPKPFVRPRKSLKVMCREIQMAYVASAKAMQHAGLEAGAGEPDRFGVLFGSEMHYTTPYEMVAVVDSCLVDGQFEFTGWGQHAMRDISPLWLLKFLPNMAACHVAIGFDARGPNDSLVLGEASSLLAIMEAASIIRRGWADVMIAGGVGARIPIGSVIFRGFANLSHRNAAPQAASRPFDKARDGMVNAEGAGIVILESRKHAEARGANIQARVLEAGSSFQRRSNSLCTTQKAIKNSITRALAKSEVTVNDLSHVNANGISTVNEDASEAQAIRETLGDVPVTAPKSLFGNIGAGTGAVEMIASILALNSNEVPATVNYETPDPACPVNVVTNPASCNKPAALLLNQSGTGQAAALVIAID
jgi:3-oxoacyl-[acyl-carrier-protein] synthase II